MYRFKTKEEFEDEFGEGWQSNVEKGWYSDMDYLFGKEITYDEWNTIQKSSAFNKYWFGCSSSEHLWTISKDMVTDKPLPNFTKSISLLDCHGWEFQADYCDEEVKGKITVEQPGEKSRVFLCQNVAVGAKCEKKWGYGYSYIIPESNTIDDIERFTNFKNFKLLNNFNNVKESSNTEVFRPDSSGKPVGTRIGIHSRDIIPASGCRPVGSKATNFWQGERVATGKVKQNFIQSY